MLIRLEHVRLEPCDNQLTRDKLSLPNVLVCQATDSCLPVELRDSSQYCSPNLFLSDERVADKFGQMWVKSAAGPASAYPVEVNSNLIRIFDIKRVLPGMMWNVTGVLSFSHSSCARGLTLVGSASS